MEVPAVKNLLSVDELVELERVGLLILRFIRKKMDEPRTDLTPVISLSFYKEEGSTRFTTDRVTEEGTAISFTAPSGCEIRKVFEYLYRRAMTLAYVMLGDRIHAHIDLSEGLYDEYHGSNISFTLTFIRRR